MITNETCRYNLGSAARSIMEHDFAKGSVLWHCTEGKDRCGLLSAVLLLALGVERRIIMEDYMLTNDVNKKKAQRYYQLMLASGNTEAEAASIRDIFPAKEEYLQGAMFAIDKQYANVDTFLRDGLGIPDELRDQFAGDILRKTG